MHITEATLSLNDLIISPLNSRPRERTPEQDEDIDGLAASIAATGLLQALVVHKLTKPKGKYGVIAGGRRLAALCRNAGDHNAEVPVRIIEDASDAELIEASITENFAREPMTDVQIYRAVKQATTAKGGKAQTDEQLADTFGVTLARMRRIRRLAFIHPEILAAYEAGEIRRDSLFAYASTDDQKAQLAAFKGFPPTGWQRNDTREIRAALGTAGDRDLAEALRFVGADAYEAAGGVVEHDLFDDKASTIKDPDLLQSLVTAKLEETRASIRAERPHLELVFAAEPPRGDYGADWQLKAEPVYQPTDQEIERLGELESQMEVCEDDELYQQLRDEAAAINAEIEARPSTIPDGATLVVMKIERGELAVSYWYPDRKAAGLAERAAAKVGTGPGETAEPKAEEDPANPALTQRAADWIKAERVLMAGRFLASEGEAATRARTRASIALVYLMARKLVRPDSYDNHGLVIGSTGQRYQFVGTPHDHSELVEALKLVPGLDDDDPMLGFSTFADQPVEVRERTSALVFASKLEGTTGPMCTIAHDVLTDLSIRTYARKAWTPTAGFFDLFKKGTILAWGQALTTSFAIYNSEKADTVKRKGRILTGGGTEGEEADLLKFSTISKADLERGKSWVPSWLRWHSYEEIEAARPKPTPPTTDEVSTPEE